jgi:hypothetical protein
MVAPELFIFLPSICFTRLPDPLLNAGKGYQNDTGLAAGVSGGAYWKYQARILV